MTLEAMRNVSSIQIFCPASTPLGITAKGSLIWRILVQTSYTRGFACDEFFIHILYGLRLVSAVDLGYHVPVILRTNLGTVIKNVFMRSQRVLLYFGWNFRMKRETFTQQTAGRSHRDSDTSQQTTERAAAPSAGY